MAYDKAAQEQQQKITIHIVCFRAILDLMQLARHRENVSRAEAGVAKISFAKVK